jgi:hypothetical protein
MIKARCAEPGAAVAHSTWCPESLGMIRRARIVGLKTEPPMALEGSGWRPGACRDPAEPHSQLGPEARPARGVLVEAEQLAELSARDPRAAQRPIQLRPEGGGGRRRPNRPRETAGRPVTGAWKLTRLIRTPRSQPCALYQCPGS